MGLKIWRQSVERLFRVQTLMELFYIFTLTLLSLLLPLSFLLISRLSSVQNLLTHLKPPSFLLSIFLRTNPTLLHLLVSFVGVTALVQGFTGRIKLPKSPIHQPRLYIAWILLCTVQVCVALGIEGTIAAGVWKVDYDVHTNNTYVSRILFFIGLHETMIHWSRTFVRPVVDDTVFGVARDERWVERVVMGASLGALWWWRIRDEVEVLLVGVDLKRELPVAFGMSDIFSWWLYYLTMTIGMVRLVKGFIWLGKALLCRQPEPDGRRACSQGVDDNV